jgi:hypothetical protein
MNEKLHHKKVTFIEEFTELLKAFDIDYDSPFIITAIS